MTPETIIRQARVDGVTLILSPTGSIKAIGNGEAVNRWLPIIREHKPGIVAELRAANDGGYDPLPDPAAEARRQRVLAMLRPATRLAVLPDTEADPEAVLLTLAIRDKGTCELRIPRAKYDPFLLLDLVERYTATVH